MVEILDIHKKYKDSEVLKGINLTINDGEIVCLIGRSGAGKSTLLNIVGSLLKPTSGKVLIDKNDIYSLSDEKLSEFRNKNIGFIFQNPQMIDELSVIENIMLPLMISQEKRQSGLKKAEELLNEFEIYKYKNEKIQNLSGGEKQRVAIIRSMIMNPKIIIADEPTGNLDEINKKYLNDCLLRMNEKYKMTILFATHDKDMSKITNNLVEIKDGKINKL